MNIIGLIESLAKFKVWVDLFFKAQGADSQLHTLPVGGRITVKVPTDLELRFRTRTGKKRFRVALADFDAEALVIERMTDKS